MRINKFVVFIILISRGQSKMVPYVINGENASMRNFPYCAYLSMKCVQKDGKTFNYMCGSSIINQFLTLTAAHCTDDCDTSTVITVSVGNKIKTGGAISTAHSYYNHEKFDPLTLANDISLVKLKTKLKFKKTVSRVALMKNPPYDEEAFVAGWGEYDDKSHKYPNALQYTIQRLKGKDECAELLQKKHARDGTFCASNHEGYPSKGDSGGALVVRNFIQIGIVSYKLKKPTKLNRKVVVYTDTGFYYKWIMETSTKILCT